MPARLGAAFLTLSVTLAAQQPALDWTLRQPFASRHGNMALHPFTGRPLRFGGFTANAPHLWEWVGDAWQRHVGAPVAGPLANASPFLFLATDEQRGELVLFPFAGGTGIWDGVHWRLAAAPNFLLGGTMPTAFDSVRGRIVVWSGLGHPLHTAEWDGTAWTTFQGGAVPPPRFGHALAFDAARGRTILFGGSDVLFGNYGDTWEWDGATWTQRTPTTSPPPREQHVMAYDPLRQRVVLRGGISATPPYAEYDDTWEWDGANWTAVNTAHQPPPFGLQSGVVTSNANNPELLFDRTRGRLTLFLDDLGDGIWEYDGVDWSQVVPASLPAGRTYAAMAFDPVRAEAVLFGGFSLAGIHGNTWLWDGRRWDVAQPAPAPSARSGHSMVFDVARNEVVLFGGAPQSGPALDDTWIWNGTWTQAQPANRPPRRDFAGMAWHGASQRVVLFGGVDGQLTNTVRGDTWTWDGTNWLQENPAQTPSARFAPAMSDAGSDVVLFGGSPNATTMLADTWSWNGTTWSQQQPAVSPPARRFSACAWDPIQGRVVLAHPNANGGAFETWTFDGTNWQQLSTATLPTGRSGHAVTYDLLRRELVLFGGIGTGGYPGGTWTLASAALQDTFGSGCAGSLGVPSLQPGAASVPQPGGVATVDLDNLPQSVAILAAGFSRTLAGTQPLPLSLQPFGMPGCDLLVSPDVNVLLLGNNHAATWYLPLPPAPGLLGVEFYVQALAWDPAANAAGVTVSNGGRCRIGN
ncbi:MAG: hypothetical protein H6838_10870 [Planctomycetes bacterium]|nr:hypothetical protein [Planctomycetota bacterium]MCB9885989.1 hypothetical protein [Planctomycetota bacterium]